LAPFIARKIENQHVVWFAESNQWVLFDEPKWFIFDLFNEGVEADRAIEKYAQKFKTGSAQSAMIVSNVYESVTKLLNPDFALPDFTAYSEQASKYHLQDKRTHQYFYNQKGFKLSYGSPALRDYFHKPLKHLESNDSSNITLEAEIFPFQHLFALRISEGACFTAQDPSQLKRLLYLRLASTFYDINPDDWLTLLHASAIKTGDHCVVMPSPSGSGKSTMAALLCAQGGEMLSDDFIPVDATNMLAYPFPAAICIKGEAGEALTGHYPQLKNGEGGRGMRYVYPQKVSPPVGSKINDVVFVKYSSRRKNELIPVCTTDALKLFLSEAWVTNNPAYVPQFLDWFAGLRFFELNYGDESTAVTTLLQIAQKS